MKPTTLTYIHDPMCSWCWAFRPTFADLRQALPPSISVTSLLGGLAVDSGQPMPTAMRQQIEDTWRHIGQSVPGTEFNHDFWRQCRPRRSTYPACRAVLLAEAAGLGDAMTLAIQQAYYLQARNPSDQATLIELAAELGLNARGFARDLGAPATQAALHRQIAQSRALGIGSFPSLVLDTGSERWPVAVDYRHIEPMIETIEALSN